MSKVNDDLLQEMPKDIREEIQQAIDYKKRSKNKIVTRSVDQPKKAASPKKAAPRKRPTASAKKTPAPRKKAAKNDATEPKKAPRKATKAAKTEGIFISF